MQTAKIVSMTRGETSGSRSTMWRCLLDNGERVNVFEHSDSYKDSSGFFYRAGFMEPMQKMQNDETLSWQKHPIEVGIIKTGNWNNVVSVTTRYDGQEPDAPYMPDLMRYMLLASMRAQLLLSNPDTIILDTETTGLNADDEIISIAIIDTKGQVQLAELVKPSNERFGATDIHGISPEMIAEAPSLAEIGNDIYYLMNNAIWVAYNSSFDQGMIERSFMVNGKNCPVPLAVVDAMEIAAMFLGDWDPARNKFRNKKLSEVAELLNIDFDDEGLHNAHEDAWLTLRVLEEIAESLTDVAKSMKDGNE